MLIKKKDLKNGMKKSLGGQGLGHSHSPGLAYMRRNGTFISNREFSLSLCGKAKKTDF